MGNFIYLCGGPKSNTIDLFDIERKAFSGRAEVELSETSDCIAFMRGSAELVVISKTKVSAFPVLNGALQQGWSKNHRQLELVPNSTPVLIPGDGLSIYFINFIPRDHKGKCVRFILEADNSVRAIEEVSA